MKKHLLFLLTLCLFSQIGFSQVYIDEMDDDDTSFMGGAGTYTFSEANGELTINANNTGMWDAFTYELNDAGAAITIDVTGNNKVFVRAKASNVGTQFRMDLQDVDGFVTTSNAIVKTLTTDYMVLEFDFTGIYSDGGFGGTACNAGPCPVDGTQITQATFFTNPGVGGFNGSVVIDYIAFGEEPTPVIMSSIFQDHFDQDSSINAFQLVGVDYSIGLDAANSEVTITGNGANAMWDPFVYIFRNPNTLDTLDLDMSGNNKIYVKVKSTVPGTALRIDAQDIDGFVTTQGSITKIVGTEYTVFEFDYAGAYSDLGFGGTACTMATAPCEVDPTRISQLIMFIEPGVGQFIGDLTFDYISFGTALEPPGAQAELIYEDHFNNETIEWTGDIPGFTVSETGTDWTITGDGAGASFAAISYVLHDKDTGEDIFLDMTPADNKLFIKAKAGTGSVPLRIDLVDTTGFITSQTAITKILSDEYVIYEYNFTSIYVDGGFGGTPCTAGPCVVDHTAISQILISIDAAAGGYVGTVDIDFISIGQPLDDDPGLGPAGVANYQDEMDDNTSFFIADAPGLVTTTVNDEWTITGDGTSEMWNSIVYTPHNDLGEEIMANAVGSGNKLYVRAKASVDMTELRIDLQDNMDFVTNLNAQSVILGTEYVVYEFDYAGAYEDGAFGGSPCTVSGCPVDGARVANLQFFVNPGVGAFNGTLDIDWISFGNPIIDLPPVGIPNYSDEIDAATIDFIIDPAVGLVTTTGDEIIITGDGTSPMWSQVSYRTNDDNQMEILADVASSANKLYIRAKSTMADTEFRVDLEDYAGYVTNLTSTSNILTTEYEIYEYDFTGKYADGAFGGSPCNTSGCPVDAERINGLQFFILPGVGAFNGDVTIDWISFGSPITGVQDLDKLQTLRAFPNPTADVFQVEYDLVKSADIQMNIYNLLGQRVMLNDLGTQAEGLNLETLNVKNLPVGMYVVQIVADGVSAGTLRLMKK